MSDAEKCPKCGIDHQSIFCPMGAEYSKSFPKAMTEKEKESKINKLMDRIAKLEFKIYQLRCEIQDLEKLP